MGAHTGRCFRQLRRTKRRKARQEDRSYKPAPVVAWSIADDFMTKMFGEMALRKGVQHQASQQLKAQNTLKPAVQRRSPRGQ